MSSEYFSLISDVRSHRPLVHNITNFVVMNFTANALLAVGASPIMAHAIEEIEEMVNLANAVVLNIGTLSNSWIPSMQQAAQHAKNRGIPLILDPVGAGATQLRTHTAIALIESGAPLIIRGNASEICALANEDVKTRGVDSLLASDQAIAAAQLLAERYQSIVVVSGAVDHIIDTQYHVEVHNGHGIMSQVTGMGCVATALLGAFAAVSPDRFTAAVATMTVMGVAGESAAKQAAGPGTFVPIFIDTLATISSDVLATQAHIVTSTHITN
jgi:hydroxyethylthiazole kinase